MAKPTNKNATLRQRQLGARLRELRGSHTLADVEAATSIKSAKLSRMESCHVRSRPTDVRTLALFYGTSNEELQHLVSTAEDAYNSSVMQDFVGFETYASTLRSHLQLEASAQRIDSFTIDLVPGLLQTRDYSRVLMESRPDVDASTIPDRLDFRSQRQQRVSSGQLELWAVLGETVLYQEIGSSETLAAQLDWLAEAPNNVTVQLLPFSAGAHASIGSSFHVFTFADRSPSIVYQDTINQGLYQDDPETVTDHQKIMEKTKAAALSPRDSQSRLRERANELRG